MLAEAGESWPGAHLTFMAGCFYFVGPRDFSGKMDGVPGLFRSFFGFVDLEGSVARPLEAVWQSRGAGFFLVLAGVDLFTSRAGGRDH